MDMNVMWPDYGLLMMAFCVHVICEPMTELFLCFTNVVVVAVIFTCDVLDGFTLLFFRGVVFSVLSGGILATLWCMCTLWDLYIW